MSTLAIIFGCISIILIITGLMGFIRSQVVFPNDSVAGMVILTIIGFIGLFLCIVI